MMVRSNWAEVISDGAVVAVLDNWVESSRGDRELKRDQSE